jgi:ATP-dependent helicase HrpB
MAKMVGESVGETIGYRVRHDTQVGARTRVEVVTEGVLTRMLQTDPALEGVGLVIFDEFHERNLQADLGLALTLQAQSLLREDLRVLVMSATMEAEPVAELLGDVPIVRSEGRAFPVETIYSSKRVEGQMELAVARVVVEAVRVHEGDVLVFLPGVAEIRRTAMRIAELGVGGGSGAKVRVMELHGSLSQEEQDRVLAPGLSGERKVVLATSLAETSLTVEGVRVVVDSGLSRVPRFSPRTGMTRLETVPVSRASADQRRGRAGRLGPGICYRMWTEPEHRLLPSRSTPELLQADLAPLALELAAWGVADAAELRWLDVPPAAALAQARGLLAELGALDARTAALTAHGRELARIGAQPRLAHMLLRARTLGLGALACELAAVLGERDLLRGAGRAAGADVRLRLEALWRSAGHAPVGATGSGASADAATARRIWADAARYKRELGEAGPASAGTTPASSFALTPGPAPAPGFAADACGLLLAFAYPDRIAQRRPNGRYLLSNGRGAAFAEAEPLASAPYLVAAELDDQGVESRIYLAAPVERAEIEAHFSASIREETEVAWDRSAQAVRARHRSKLGALILHEQVLANPDPTATLQAMLDAIGQEGLDLLPWSKAAKQLRARMGYMHHFEADWPDMSDDHLLQTRADWLGSHLYGMRNREDLQKINLVTVLEALLTWPQKQQLDTLVPTHLVVPSGSRLAIDYSDPQSPALAVRLQELFGLSETPSIVRGRIPLTLHLLSPASRPVQVTRDLASFWREAYFEVKKDLKGRYPKHYWPDDPLIAEPTNRARPNKLPVGSEKGIVEKRTF